MLLRCTVFPLLAVSMIHANEPEQMAEVLYDEASLVAYNDRKEVYPLDPCEDGVVEMICKEEPLIPAYNATARIPLNEKNVVTFSGSFIWWQPTQDGMDVAYSSSSAFANSQGKTSWDRGKVIEMEAHFRPGYKLGIAYAFPYDNWEWFMDYTSLHTSNHVKASRKSGGFLMARWISPTLFSSNDCSGLSTHWRLESDFLNVEVGRRFYAGKKLVLKPHIGVAGALIDQRLRGTFNLLSGLVAEVKHKSDGSAVGPRFGIDADWYLTRSFSMVGKIGADILYQNYSLKMWQNAENDATVRAHSSNHLNTYRPELDLYFGFSWETYFACNEIGFALEAGYDAQVWWNQNMIRWYNDNTWLSHPQGNLYLQGFSLTAKMDF